MSQAAVKAWFLFNMSIQIKKKNENMLGFFQIHIERGLYNYILTHCFLFVQQEVGESMLEGRQTDVTHSVFTTSPTAYETEHTTAAPAGRDQERKANLGTINSMNSLFAAEPSV